MSRIDDDAFDLDAYLRRIGHRGGRRADLQTLRAVVAGHARHIAFENLDPFLGRPVALDAASLQAKLVQGGRGGYCFEQNLLLSHGLAALGFHTTGLAARVLWNRPIDAELPARGHMLVRVEMDDGARLVDVGFGGLTLTGVLELETGREQSTPHEKFRLSAVGDEYLMQARVNETWQTLYRFGLAEALLSDYEVTSWYLSHHPESHFVNGLMAARADDGRRYALRGPELTVHHLDRGPERRSLTTPSEVVQALEDEFLLDLSRLPDLTTALSRLFPPA